MRDLFLHPPMACTLYILLCGFAFLFLNFNFPHIDLRQYAGILRADISLQRSTLVTRNIMTPEAFCWLYAAGCVDAREQEMVASGEHQISKGYFAHLYDCVETGRKPSDDVVRRIFRRPFEILGESCTLDEMMHYWRVTHQNPTEKTPVFKVQIAPYTKKMYPREDRDGMWWETRIFDWRAKRFERLFLHDVHQYAHQYTPTSGTSILAPGAWVFAHATTIGSDAMYGIIAEKVPVGDPVHLAFPNVMAE